MARACCSYCGLPLSTADERDGELFCCYGCYLVSRAVGGGEDAPRSWHILRLAVGALLAMNVMMISALMYTGTVEAGAVPGFRWALLGLATPAMAILGYPFLLGAAAELRRKRLSLDALIALGAFTAYGVSAANTIRGEGHVYFDVATMLLTLVTFGKLIETTAKTRMGQLVRSLERMLPKQAARVGPEGEEPVAVGALRAGDLVRVTPGGALPADGRIERGRTWIEEASFTGESRPRSCGPGERVFAGTVNGEGEILLRVEHVGEELLLRRIIGMVEEAREARAPLERLSEQAAGWFTPIVLLLALAAGAFWVAAGNPAKGALAALSVIVVSCPCAMGIAAPLAAALAINRAARAGMLVKGGDTLERIGQVRTIFFDKTGTVTTGSPEIESIRTCEPDVTEPELLGRLAALESRSDHALARAVREEARRRGLPLGALREAEVLPGRGVRGKVEWAGRTMEMAAGSAEFIGAAQEQAAGTEVEGPVIYVAWDGRLRGVVRFSERVRPGMAETLRRLDRLGVAVAMLSGDRPEASEAVARAVGMRDVRAARLPDEKIAEIRAARREGAVAMVGDGVNDAPALSAADVGIAVGAGTELAEQAGNVVMVGDRLELTPWLVELSRYTRRIMAQNLAWAFGYNAVALGAAAAGLLHPLVAALAMVASSLTVLSNSARIQGFAAPEAALVPEAGAISAPADSVRT